MAKRNSINANAERKIERSYGKYATTGRKGGAFPAMANIMQDKRAGRNATSSMMRYAGGENRAVYVNGQKQKGGAANTLRRYNQALRNAGSKTYNPASLF